MSNVLSALQHIDVAAVSYQEWVNVGMALKAEGFDWTVWDDWSRNDPRYHPGEGNLSRQCHPHHWGKHCPDGKGLRMDTLQRGCGFRLE